MFNSLKIRWKILLSSYAVMLAASGLITFLAIVSLRNNAAQETADLRIQEVDKVKSTLKNYVDIAHEIVAANLRVAKDRSYLEKRYGKELKNIVDVADGIVKDTKAAVQRGELSNVEARILAAEKIKQIRYDNGKGYVWINDTTLPYPKMVMHPTVPSLDGKTLDNPKFNCALGRKENLFKAFVDVTAQGNGDSFVDYLWPKPTKDGLSKEQPKLSYVKLDKDWGWIIGTGIYVDDALADAVEKSKQDIKNMRYADGKGYFWINDLGQPFPKMVMHPTVPALDGKVLDNPKYNCALGKKENLFKAFVDVTDNDDGEGYVDYLWSKPTDQGLSEDLPKMSYVRRFPELNWIIGTGEYIEFIDAVVAEKSAKLEKQIDSLLFQVLGSTMAISLAAFLALWLLARRISTPIEASAGFADRVGAGDLNAELTVNSHDEVGMLANSLVTMRNNLSSTIHSINSISHGLSDGANNQASSLEEASASLEEISSMVQQSASTSDTCNTLISDAKSSVGQTTDAMNELVTFMGTIAESSHQTQKIVKTIDEIAFQTNLLALNAAVEAARAGEAGQGFAVVADEVRNLAMRAATAAKDTAELIEDTVEKISSGESLTSTTGQQIHSLNEKVEKLSHLIGETAQAAKEQAAGIEQINTAVSVINEVVQENANSAGELVNVVGIFTQDRQQEEGRGTGQCLIQEE